MGRTGDPAREIAERWCALEVEHYRLIYKWQAVEAWLFKHREWPSLTDAEQALVPEGAQLAAIDDQIDAISRTQGELLPFLKTTSATTRDGAIARFEALTHFVLRDEHPDARALLISSIADLKRLWI